MLKSKTDANQAEIVRVLRTLGASVAVTSSVGKGFPDLVCGFRGENYLIEVKDPKKGKLTHQQEVFIEGWLGSPVLVVRTPEQALNLVLSK